MKYSIVLILLIHQLSCTSQTLRKFLVDDYKLKDTTITEIVENKTYLEKLGTSTYKRTYFANPSGFITQMVGLDTEGKLSIRRSYNYGDTGKLLQIKEEYWNHSSGYSIITTNFYFDSFGLAGMEIIGNDGDLMSKSTVKTENGHPVKMTSFDSNGLLMGNEIAEYNYDKNEVSINVLNAQGKPVGNTFVIKLNLQNVPIFKVDGTIKNEYDDIIKELKPKCLSCDELVTYIYEYKYDKKRNWISKVTYSDEGGSRAKILKEQRIIKYRNKL